MSNNKNQIVRSSAAEYLTFLTATGESDVNAIYADENVWMTQKMMGIHYNVGTNTINYHLKKIFTDSELEEKSVIRKFRITASDGKIYNTSHYNLKAIIAVGNKVDTPIDSTLQLTQYEILTHSGSISAEIARKHAESEFELYRVKQDKLFASDFDRFILESEKEVLENE